MPINCSCINRDNGSCLVPFYKISISSHNTRVVVKISYGVVQIFSRAIVRR